MKDKWYEDWTPWPLRTEVYYPSTPKCNFFEEHPIIVLDGGILTFLLLWWGLVQILAPPSDGFPLWLAAFFVAAWAIAVLLAVLLMAVILCGPFLIGFPIWYVMLHVQWWRDNVPTAHNDARWVLAGVKKGGEGE